MDRHVLYFDDADFGYAPPPPPVFLAPPQRAFIELAPPPPPVSLYALPTPAYVPVPAWVEPPAYVEPPHDNFIFRNIHNTVVNNTVVNNNTTNTMTTEPGSAQARLRPGTSSSSARGRSPGPKACGHRARCRRRRGRHACGPAAIAAKEGSASAKRRPACGAAGRARPAHGQQGDSSNAGRHTRTPGENGKALPPIANMPPLKSETRQEPPRAAAHQMAAPQPPAPEAPQRNLPANGSSRPTPDIMEVPARSADHHRPRPLDQTDAAPAPPKHQPNPQALPRAPTGAPPRTARGRPKTRTPAENGASGRKACTCLGTQAP